MSESVRTGAMADAPWYRRESWLVVSALALIAMFAAIFVADALRMIVAGLAGVLMVVAVLLLVRHEQTLRAAAVRAEVREQRS